MSVKSGELITFEEKDQYIYTVDLKKNFVKLVFTGDLKKAEDIPNYVEHTRKVIELVKDGYAIIAHAKTGKSPGFSVITPFKESQKILQSKRTRKAAAVVERIVQKMTVNVLIKLSGMAMKVFNSMDEAEKWIFEED